MSLLDDTDSLRSCQLDIHDGVNSVSTLTEDSAHQYSPAQIQRQIQQTNEARQQID